MDNLDINLEELKKKDINQQDQEMDTNRQRQNHRSHLYPHLVDRQCKKRINNSLGKNDMSSTVNKNLRQCVMRGGLPFEVTLPKYKQDVLDAMEEEKKLSKDPNTKRYASFSEAMEDIDS